MRQPKFKFGDKVIDTREEKTFVVKNITQALDTFIYSDGINSAPEKCAELYQEPQKKKLYAYKSTISINGRIEFYEFDGLSLDLFKRYPEYDMDFSLGYACTEIK